MEFNSTVTNNTTQTVELGVTGVLLFVQILSMFLNSLVLFLMVRQGLKQLDRSLASIVAVADVLFSFYKIVSYVYTCVHAEHLHQSVYSTATFGQFDGIVHVNLTQISGLGIAYLAFIRFWVIVLRKQLNNYVFVTLFTLKALFFFAVSIVAGVDHEFEYISNSNYNAIKVNSESVSGMVAMITLLVYETGILITVNLSYIAIAVRYYTQIASLKTKMLNSASVVAYEQLSSQNQKVKVVLKILLILVIYTLLITPATVISYIEIFTRERRSASMDILQGSLLLLVPLFNPVFLITLHSETWLETKKLFKGWKSKMFKTNASKELQESFSSSSLSLSDKPLHLDNLNFK